MVTVQGAGLWVIVVDGASVICAISDESRPGDVGDALAVVDRAAVAVCEIIREGGGIAT